MTKVRDSAQNVHHRSWAGLWLRSPANFQMIFTSPETTMIALPVGENRMIVASFVLTQYQRVTEDRRTDRLAYG